MITVTPSGQGLGARVENIDLSQPLTPENYAPGQILAHVFLVHNLSLFGIMEILMVVNSKVSLNGKMVHLIEVNFYLILAGL